MRVIVIGGGAAGSAATEDLARRGHSVTLLERFERAHVHGSSHGSTRIFRVAYREAPYTAWAGASIPLWRQLQERSGQTLLEQSGQIDHGFHGALAEIEANLAAGGWSSERLTAAQAQDRWPGMRFAGDVLVSPDGGRVFADRTVAALLRLAEEAGAELRFEEPALSIAPDGDGALVTTALGEYRADVVIVSAGGWLPHLDGLSEFGIRLPSLTATQQYPVHFAIRPGYSFPSWVNHVEGEASDHRFLYGAYGLESPGEGIKVGIDSMDVIGDLFHRDLSVPEVAMQTAAAYAEEWLPGADISQGSGVSCMFTMTEDSHFVMDRRGPIVVASPCSGHGFKFTPILGRILADLATGADHGVTEWRLPN